jgi:ribonuclease HI
VYRDPTNWRWIEVGYHLPDMRSSHIAELIRILKGLEIGLNHFKDLVDSGIAIEGKLPAVKLFSDSQVALQNIRDLPCKRKINKNLDIRSVEVVRKIIASSQCLRELGISVEMHWVPSHAGIPGNQKADSVARLAAKRLEWFYRWSEETVLVDPALCGYALPGTKG